MSIRILSRSVICGLNSLRPSQITGARNFKKWLAPTLRQLEKRRKKLEPIPETPRSQFLDWNYKAEWHAFGVRLHEEFDENLLQRAFTHRSFVVKEEMVQKEAGIENPEVDLEDNDLLIDRGDSFMSGYIRRYVSLLLPSFPYEGVKAIHDHLMQDDILAHVSKHLGTKDLILSADVPPEQETLALTLKAVVGALLESSGPERAGLFVRDFIVTLLVEKDVNELWYPTDPLAVLENIMKNEGRDKPEPRLINEAGRNTVLSTYHVGLYSDKQFLGAGGGETVTIALEVAALDALRRLFNTTEKMAPFNFKFNPYTEESVTSISNPSIAEWRSSVAVNL